MQSPKRSPTLAKRPFILRQGKKIRPFLNRLIAPWSLVPNTPVLASEQFNWTEALRKKWPMIREEALTVLRTPKSAPALRDVSPDHMRIAIDDRWRSFFLIGYGQRIEENLRRCPATASLVERIPGLNSAFFSILHPGAHIPRHTGVTKGLLTCHLGLQVPREDGLHMKVGSQDATWHEGEVLIFDDTWPHEVWNDTNGTRIVLLCQFERPLRQPGRAIARMFLAGIRRSAFVSQAQKNIEQWGAAFDNLDTEVAP